MEIRRLQENDYTLLASAIQSLIPEDERDGGVASDAHLRRALRNPSCYFIVCLIDSAPAGYLSAFGFPAIDDDCSQVYLYDIVVAEKHRRKGIGSRMIEELKRHCRMDGADHIWLGTSLENVVAQRTFEGTGARKVSETYIEYVYSLDEDHTYQPIQPERE
jgi:ribosomal protein S18 acetylase RimI-like enzyme